MRMQETLIEVRVQNALLRDEMARVILERDNLRAQVMATHLKELVQPTDFGRIVPVLLSKIPRVLSELENMGQVRLVMCAMLQMLPDNHGGLSKHIQPPMAAGRARERIFI